MTDLTFKTALAANELVPGTPGANQEQITGAEVVGATSGSNADSGWTFTSLRSWVITHPDLMLKSEYDTEPTNGIVNAAGSVENDVGGSKSAQQIIDHLDDNSIHRALNDGITTTTNLWSASKINTELASKASDSALTSHVNNTANPHSVTHAQLPDKGSNTHAQLDAHVASIANPHSVTHAQLPDNGVNTHAQIDTHIGSSANPHGVTHAQLPDNGTYTHAQLDAHVNSSANPHGVTAAQAGAAPASHVGDSTHLSTDERNALTAADNPSGANPIATVGDLVTLQDEGVDLTKREKVNFTGAGVTAVDNPGQNRIDISIPGGGGAGRHDIADGTQTYPDQPTLRFLGAGVTVADNAGNNSTDVTIAGGGGGGDVTGPAIAVQDNISSFADTSGKVIKDAGYAMPGAGGAGQVLTKVDGTDYNWSWQDPPAAGDVSGPPSSTDNALAVWDGASGDLLQDSSVLLVDVIARTVSGQYASLAQKASPVDEDLLLLEDSQATGAKKKLRIADLPSGGGDVEEAPQDGIAYARRNAAWVRSNQVFVQAADPAGNAQVGDIWIQTA